MMRGLLCAAVVLAAAAPAASAHYHDADCAWEAVETAPGQWEGYAYGYAVGDPGDEITVTCYLKVNGTVATATPPGSGTTVAVTHGPVAYAEGPLDSHVNCVRVTRNGVLYRDDCYHVDNTQIPPQAVWDLLDQLPAR